MDWRRLSSIQRLFDWSSVAGGYKIKIDVQIKFLSKAGVIMQEPELLFLSQWQNFYMLIGTAAATLTGLMFVATTLVAGIETHGATMYEGVSAFSTPTVVHFGAVLLIAGILSAP